MFRDQLAKLGFTRRVDKWLDAFSFADSVGQPAGFKEQQQAAISWVNDYLVVYHPGGTRSEYFHEIIEPLDTLRLPEFEQVSVLHPPGTAKFGIFEAFGHPAPGVGNNTPSVGDKAQRGRNKAKVQRVYPTPVPGPDGDAAVLEGKHVEFQNLRMGDILELRYSRDWVKPLDQGPYQWDTLHLGRQLSACAKKRVTLAVHESLKVELRDHNFDLHPELNATPREWHERGYHFREWCVAEQPVFEPEFNQPPPRDCEPWIDVSTCTDWEPIAKWMHKHLVQSQPKSDAVRTLLAEIAPEGETAERAKQCYDYCRDQVAYGRLAGVGPEQDAMPSDRVAETQRGDCKDQTSLLMGLYRELGIPCRAAAVHAGDPSRIDFLPSQRFDHVIVCAEVDGATRWLDPTASHVPFGGIVPELEGSRSLLLGDDGSFELATIAESTMDANTCYYLAEASLEDRDLMIDATIDYNGRYSCGLRGAELAAPGSVVKGMEAIATDRIGACTVESVALEDGWKLDDTMRVRMRIEAPHWIKSAGDLLLFKFPWLGAHIAPSSVALKQRTRDYLTGGPDRATYELRLKLPEGKTLANAPESREFRGPHSVARAEASLRDGTLHLLLTLETDASRIETADYPRFRQFVHDLDGFFEDQHVLA